MSPPQSLHVNPTMTGSASTVMSSQAEAEAAVPMLALSERLTVARAARGFRAPPPVLCRQRGIISVAVTVTQK